MRIILFICLLICGGELFPQNNASKETSQLYQRAVAIANENPDSAIKIHELLIKANDDEVKLRSYLKLFDIYYSQRREMVKGLKYSIEIAKLYQKKNDTLSYIRQYRNISVILVELNRSEEAEVYSLEVLEYARRKNIPDLIISASISLAEFYSFYGRTDTAVATLETLRKNLPPGTKKADELALIMNLGNFYFNYARENGDKENYRRAIFTATQLINLIKNDKNEESKVGYSYGLIAASYMELGSLAEAEKHYKMALQIFQHINRPEQLEGLYYELIQLYIRTGDKEKSTYYLEKHDSISRLIYNSESAKSVSEMKIQFETDKKEAHNKLLQVENELSTKTLKQQKLINFFIIGGLIIASLFSVFIFYSLKKQRSANNIISKQKTLVEAKHKEISDSIMYAERIQKSFLATDELLKKHLKEYFVFFKPKDVVSGDFYFASVLKNNKFALITADSTGHGVPGAIMSILNITSLEKAIDQGLTQPAEIFNHTRNTIIDRLKKDGSKEGGKDGMDAGICVYDFPAKKLSVASANSQVWIVRNSEVIEIKPDKMPIGKHEKQNAPFTQQEIQLQDNDMVFTLTDGFSDQFGGSEGKKFMSKKLRVLLQQNANLSLAEQKTILEKTLSDWKGDLEQIDDVCIIGIRV